jgi:hypothetical protein
MYAAKWVARSDEAAKIIFGQLNHYSLARLFVAVVVCARLQGGRVVADVFPELLCIVRLAVVRWIVSSPTVQMDCRARVSFAR